MNYPYPHEGNTEVKVSHIFLLHFYLAILLCSFDFRASSSGKGFMVQAPVWGFYFLSFVITFFQLLIARSHAREMRYFLLICVSFLVCSTLTGVTLQQETWGIFTNFVAFSIYVTAAVATLVTLKLCSNRTALLSTMKNICLAFMVLHFLVVYFIGGGINLAVSRYEYLSGATIPASALLTIGAVLHLGIKEILIAITNVAIILISVTRTQLAVIVVQLASVFLAAPALAFRLTVLKKISAVALLALSIIAINIAAETGLTHRWLGRLTAGHTMKADPTVLTRYAEIHYMFGQLTASATQCLLGNGIAARTKLTGPSAKLVAKLVGKDSVTSVRSTGFGHNNHLSVLFVGGLLFGMPLLLLNFANGFQALFLIGRVFKPNAFQHELVHIGTWGALIVLGMLAVGFLSGTFADRPACLWYGIGTGMLYWARGEIRHHPPTSKISTNAIN